MEKRSRPPAGIIFFMIPSCAAHLLPEYYICIKTKGRKQQQKRQKLKKKHKRFRTD
ncbi:hypothetical protein M441DRAFT_348201 [Trichoderma asperellum CBS 433.97]|uniref:Uncharacterized protein n=1 Tax=Trichoderma asperellum (strain ATCC 204424 / CBS 433.97 / NBRC 101777) TaxID=1042311 RepID=A0A2T3ZHW6_TRIA4|nr:hypothetical protein M441DRAFT_348201 [Trichoderma asperellum CBS 433.97]PTB44398.1 hypothetical protein M441DRAFT_348201 [Trichoderma asperellum CBS 433.97]